MFGVEVSEDGAYLIITVSESCAPMNMMHVMPLANFSVDAPLDCFKGDAMIKVIDEMSDE